MSRRFPRMPAVLAALVAVVVAPAGLTACASDRGESGSAPPPAVTTTVPDGAVIVRVANLVYEPKSVTIDAGQTVAWVFDDGNVPHNVVGKGFRSETRRSGVFSHRFENPGTYRYLCTLHPRMRGTVTVS